MAERAAFPPPPPVASTSTSTPSVPLRQTMTFAQLAAARAALPTLPQTILGRQSIVSSTFQLLYAYNIINILLALCSFCTCTCISFS